MKSWIAALLLALPLAAWAHGPTPQKAEETVEINAAPAAVWAKIKDFGAIASWQPALEKVTAEGGNGNGAKRTLTFKSGGVLEEELDDYSDAEMRYAYRMGRDMDIKALPVSSLNGRLEVTAGKDGKTVVTWKARFYRAFTGNEPPAGQDDATAVEGVTAYFRQGLDNLKQLVESGK